MRLRDRLTRRLSILALTAALTLGGLPAHSIPNDVSLAAGYCRQFSDSIKLSDDTTILCFDGDIRRDLDVEQFRRLGQNGLAVVRSSGGYLILAIIIANILMEKNATVIIYDYCLSACANFLFVATDRTYVLKNTIVAWHGGPTKSYCSEAILKEASPSAAPHDAYCGALAFVATFYRRRGLDDRFVYYPQTPHTKNMLHLLTREGFNFRDASGRNRVFWMWNPINHRNYFSGRIAYESYPNDQSEVNSIVERFRLGVRVIYDPRE